MEYKIPKIKLRSDNKINWENANTSLLKGSADPDYIVVEQKLPYYNIPNKNKTVFNDKIHKSLRGK